MNLPPDIKKRLAAASIEADQLSKRVASIAKEMKNVYRLPKAAATVDEQSRKLDIISRHLEL